MKFLKYLLGILLSLFILFNMNVSALAKTPQPYMYGTVENWVASGTTTTQWSPFKPSFNQASAHVFSSSGSGFFWGESSQSAGTWRVGVSIGGTDASVSIGYQPGSIASPSGIFEPCPDSLIGKEVKLYCRRQYKVSRYAVYRKNKYDPGQGTFSRYEYRTIPIAKQTKVDLYNAYN